MKFKKLFEEIMGNDGNDDGYFNNYIDEPDSNPGEVIYYDRLEPIHKIQDAIDQYIDSLANQPENEDSEYSELETDIDEDSNTIYIVNIFPEFSNSDLAKYLEDSFAQFNFTIETDDEMNRIVIEFVSDSDYYGE